MAVESVTEDLTKFKHLQLLRFKQPAKVVVQLFYDETTKYLDICRTPQPLLLDSRTADIISGDELNPLIEKVNLHLRFAGKDANQQNIEYMLRVNEIDFILKELRIEKIPFVQAFKSGLVDYLTTQFQYKALTPLYLEKFLMNTDFVFNYLLTNLGPPEDTGNYFNKLTLLLQQTLENTYQVRSPDPFKVLHALVTYCQSYNEPAIILEGKEKSILIRSKLYQDHRLLGFSYNYHLGAYYADHDLVRTIRIDNRVIEELSMIFQRL